MADEIGGLWLVAGEPLRLSNDADEDATAVHFEVDATGALELTPASGEPIEIAAGLLVDGDVECMSNVTIDGNLHTVGNVGIGALASAAVRVLLAAGSALLAPLAFSAGTLLTFPADGRVEYDGSAYYATVGTDRQKLLREPGSTGITTVGTLSAGAIPYSLLTGTVPTWNQDTTGSAAKLTTARTIGGVSFDGTANITVASATGGFTVSGGALALGANDLTMTGSLGATGARLTKGWFTDLQVTNAIAGSITGSAATLTTTRTIWGQSFDGSANVIGALSGATTGAFSGAVSVGTLTVTVGAPDASLVIASALAMVAGDGGPNWQTIGASNTATTTPGFVVSRARNTIASPQATLSGDALFNLSAQGYDGTTRRTAAQIRFLTDGNTTSTSAPGKVSLWTTPSGSTSALERFTIDSTGAATFQGDVLFTDASYDIGKSGATRPRDGFFSRNVVIGGTLGVGISPITTMHLSKDGVVPHSSLYNTTNEPFVQSRSGGITAQRILAAGNFAGAVFTRVAGTLDTPTVVSDGDEIGRLIFEGYDGTARREAASIRVGVAGGTPSSTSMPGRIALRTTSVGSVSTVERVAINDSVTLSADLLFTDATYDIGKSGATRPRDIFTSRNIDVGGIVKIGVTTNSPGDYFYIGANVSTGPLVDIAGSTPIWHNRRSNGTQASRTNVAAEDIILAMRGSAWSGATGYWATAQMEYVVDGSVTDNQRPASRIQFTTNQQNAAQTTQWKITPGGNLQAVNTGVAIQTGTPSGGTAKPWKFGSVITGEVGLALNTTSHVELDVNGTLVKLALIL